MHEHTRSCYTNQLICGFDSIEVATESEATHTHTLDCYELDCHFQPEDNSGSGQLPPTSDIPEDEDRDELSDEDMLLFSDQFMITGFVDLDESVKYQTLEPGTAPEALELPTSLEAWGYPCTEDYQTHSKSGLLAIDSISWKIIQDDEDICRCYPVLPDEYHVPDGVELPEILVRVGGERLALLAEVNEQIAYDSGDVAAFKALLEQYPLIVDCSGLTPNDPATWEEVGIASWREFMGSTTLNTLCFPPHLFELALAGPMNISGFENLEELQCSGLGLTELTVDSPNLKTLNVSDNDISSLSLSNPKDLEIFYCSSNPLETLDLTGYSALSVLVCIDCQLTELNISPIKNTLNQLFCSDNNLTTLSLIGADNLAFAVCDRNPQLASVILPNGKTVRLDQGSNGIAEFAEISNKDNSWAVEVNATPEKGYLFDHWECSALSETDAVKNSLIFLPTEDETSIAPVFVTDTQIENATAVSTAKGLIETGTYTVSQETANTEEAVKTWVAGTIDSLSGMNDTGISITPDNISISNFTAATVGDSSSPAGTDGSFTFTVSLSKGTATGTVSGLNGTITASHFDGPSDDQLIAAAKTAVENAAYSAAQENANSQETLKIWLAERINGISEIRAAGVSVTAADIDVTGFTPAQAGSENNTAGISGSFVFTVTITRGQATAAASGISGTITATAYVPGGDPDEPDSGNGDSDNDDSGNGGSDNGGSGNGGSDNGGSGNGGSGNGGSGNGGSGSGSSSSGDSGSGSAPTTSTGSGTAPNTWEITGGQPDQDGNVYISSSQILNAVNSASARARTNGTLGSGLTVAVGLPSSASGLIIEQEGLNRLASSDVNYLRADFGDLSVTLHRESLTALKAQAAGPIALTARPAGGLSSHALSLIGSRPVFDLNVLCQQNGVMVPAADTGTITIGIRYIPAQQEMAAELCGVYVDPAGGAHLLSASAYDPVRNMVFFKTDHCSIYGVGRQAVPAFADTASHWSRADAAFAASRGLIPAASANAFNPEAPMTRGAVAAALGRLAQIDPAMYTTVYADVSAPEAPYADWAVRNHIMDNRGETTFAPDQTVTRGEMALIAGRFAASTKTALPSAYGTASFSDSGQFGGSDLQRAAGQMCRAGLMTVRADNCFAPDEAVTRAEAAALMHQLVKLSHSSGTLSGWQQASSGTWFYYENCRPATGWQEIGGKRYYFHPDGVMASNTTVEGTQLGSDGAAL